MATINKKLIHFRSLSDFEARLAAGDVLSTSIVWIKDAKKIWTHGEYYDCNGGETLTEADILAMGFTKNAGTITGVSANGTSVATSGVANIPAASTSKYGVTKLSSATNSTSTTEAATASAVKAAYDLANGKQDKLTSGTNIKTINGESILGDGDLSIQSTNIVTLDIGSLPTQNSSVTVDLTEEQLRILRLEDAVIKLTFNTLSKSHICTMFHTVNGVTHMYSGVAYIVKNSVEYDTNKRYVYGQFKQTLDTSNPITFTISDIILTESDVKTINGQSIIGSGDITISGGSSGGGGYVPMSNTWYDSPSSVTIAPNSSVEISDLGLTSITINLTEPTNNSVVNTYTLVIRKYGFGNAFTFDKTIFWANDNPPIFDTSEDGEIVEISIKKINSYVNGYLGTWAKYSV